MVGARSSSELLPESGTLQAYAELLIQVAS